MVAGADSSPQRSLFIFVAEVSISFAMLSPERIKELFEDTKMSDEEAEEIRDSLTAFVRKALDKWIQGDINN